METNKFDADLFDAVEFGDLDWVKQAFISPNNSYDINMRDINGDTLLMIAKRYNHHEIAEFLINQGA